MAIFRVPWNIVFPGAGSPGANIWHIRTSGVTGGTETTEATTLCGYIRTFYDALKSYYPATTTVTLGTVTEEGTSREITPTALAVTGLGTGSAPQLLAAVVTWRTTVAARRGRGRTFIGPLAPSTMQTDGTPLDSFRTAVQNAAAALITSSTGMGAGAVGVWGYSSPKTPGKANPRNPADPKVFRDFTGYQMRDLFGVLRSRRD